MKTIGLLLTALFLVMPQTATAAKNICGPLRASLGPFDYRKAPAEQSENLYLVEMAHFTPEVEEGIKGNTGLIGGDLSYTLHVFPNHIRALTAMGRVAVKKKTVQLDGSRYPVECYFERAMRFAPDDGAVRATYGNYLFAINKGERAFDMYRQAVELDPMNPTFNYNLGLTFFKQKKYTEANLYAQKAYALGFPLPGLKNMLVAAGQWNDKIDSGIAAKNEGIGGEQTNGETKKAN